MKYRIKFSGRKQGALGITYPIYETVIATSNDIEEIREKIYALGYEHVKIYAEDIKPANDTI